MGRVQNFNDLNRFFRFDGLNGFAGLVGQS